MSGFSDRDPFHHAVLVIGSRVVKKIVARVPDDSSVMKCLRQFTFPHIRYLLMENRIRQLLSYTVMFNTVL